MSDQESHQYLYWFSQDDWGSAKPQLKQAGYGLSRTLMTPCQVLRSHGKKLVYAPPSIWSFLCNRQGSWYREGERNGHTMLMSDHQLPEAFDAYLDARMDATDFAPETRTTEAELLQIVAADAYQQKKPKQWEGIGWWDAFSFRLMFTATGFWGLADNLKKHWITHKANHANFLTRTVTTKIDGEEVPHSVSGNAGVCSSCVEFFNVAGRGRKLVAACPGSVIFGGAKRNVFYDVQPTGKG